MKVVPQHLVDQYFWAVAKYLEMALADNPYTTWDMQSLHQICATRQAFLFVDDDMKNAAMVQFVPYHAGTALYIMLVGGEGGFDWKEGVKTLREFAGAYGVDTLTCTPRKGWGRLFDMKTVAQLCIIEDNKK